MQLVMATFRGRPIYRYLWASADISVIGGYIGSADKQNHFILKLSVGYTCQTFHSLQGIDEN